MRRLQKDAAPPGLTKAANYGRLVGTVPAFVRADICYTSPAASWRPRLTARGDNAGLPASTYFFSSLRSCLTQRERLPGLRQTHVSPQGTKFCGGRVGGARTTLKRNMLPLLGWALRARAGVGLSGGRGCASQGLDSFPGWLQTGPWLCLPSSLLPFPAGATPVLPPVHLAPRRQAVSFWMVLL